MKQIGLGALIGAGIVGVLLGLYWVLWQLWMFVLNGFGAPYAIANPDYWVFVSGLILLGLLKYAFTDNGKKKD